MRLLISYFERSYLSICASFCTFESRRLRCIDIIWAIFGDKNAFFWFGIVGHIALLGVWPLYIQLELECLFVLCLRHVKLRLCLRQNPQHRADMPRIYISKSAVIALSVIGCSRDGSFTWPVGIMLPMPLICCGHRVGWGIAITRSCTHVHVFSW